MKQAENKNNTPRQRLDKAQIKSGFTNKTFRIGSYSIFASLVVIAIAFGIIMIMDALPSTFTKFDVSANQLYSVSDQTKDLLKNLDQEVDIYLLAQKGMEDSTITELLNRYKALSDQVKVITKDPVVYPNFAKQYTDEDVYNNSVIVVSGGRSRFVSYQEIYVTTYTSYYDYYTDFDGERCITSAIDYVNSDILPKIYLLTGHGEKELNATVKDAVAKENIDTASLNLLTQDKIPDDAQCLLINAPSSDLNQNEKELILDYLKNGGHLLVLSDYSDVGMPNLASLMAYYGVKAVDGIVIEGDADYCVSGYNQYLMPKLNDHAITSPIKEGGYFVLMPLAQGISRLEDCRDTIVIDDLLTTSDKSYSKADAYNITTLDKEEGDIVGPFSLGAAITESTADGGETQIVWYTTSMLIDESVNEIVSGANLDLFLNSLDWMCERVESISIHAKNMDSTTLSISSATSSLWTFILVGLVPLAFLVFGIAVWMRRKKK